MLESDLIILPYLFAGIFGSMMFPIGFLVARYLYKDFPKKAEDDFN